MNAKVRKALLAAAADPDLSIETGVTALLRISIAHCVENPNKVSLYDLGNVLQGASKALEGAKGDNSRSILQEIQEFIDDDGEDEGESAEEDPDAP